MRNSMTQVDVIASMALACYLLAVLPFVPGGLGNTAGVVLCFALVGILWASALVPRHSSALARFMAVLACSLGAGIVGGLILNVLPSGLNSSNWLHYSVIVAAIGYVTARVRGADALIPWDPSRWTTPSVSACAKVVASGVVIAVAVVISATATTAGEKSFTELWLVPESPLNSPVRAVDATVGVKNHESSSQDYTVVMNTGKTIFETRMTLAPQQEWTQAVVIDGVEARAFLYRGDAMGEPYRTVWIARQ